MVKFSENDPNYSVVVQKLAHIFDQAKLKMSETIPKTSTSRQNTGGSMIKTTSSKGPKFSGK